MKEIPKGKHLFGFAKIGEKGQILIPKEAREVFGLRPGDKLLMLGDEERGIALIKVDEAAMFADMMPYIPVIGESTEGSENGVSGASGVSGSSADGEGGGAE